MLCPPKAAVKFDGNRSMALTPNNRSNIFGSSQINNQYLTMTGSKSFIPSARSTASQGRRPENERDFKLAYKLMVDKMLKEQGYQISGLLTEKEVAMLTRNKQETDREFLKRVNDCIAKKQMRMSQLKEEMDKSEVKECTFTPVSYTKSYVSNQSKTQLNDKGQLSQKDLKNFLEG